MRILFEYNYLIATVALIVILLYHIYYFYQLRVNPLKVSLGLANHFRASWVRTIIIKNDPILAVQTIRNWIMSANFFASTAVLMSLASLSVAFNLPSSMHLKEAFHFFEYQNTTMWEIKWLILAGDLFFAFFNFTLSIRHYNHACFMISIPSGGQVEITPGLITRATNSGAFHNMLGMRGYYFTIPLVMWIFGPHMLLLGVAMLIIALYVLDHNI